MCAVDWNVANGRVLKQLFQNVWACACHKMLKDFAAITQTRRGRLEGVTGHDIYIHIYLHFDRVMAGWEILILRARVPATKRSRPSRLPRHASDVMCGGAACDLQCGVNVASAV